MTINSLWGSINKKTMRKFNTSGPNIPKKRLQPDSADAVLNEVLEILKLISPGFDCAAVSDIFRPFLTASQQRKRQ